MNGSLIDALLLALQAEQSRIYHMRLIELDAAIRELEENPAQYTVAEFNDLLRGLVDERARRVAEWQREKGEA